jgi:hypothetical protein
MNPRCPDREVCVKGICMAADSDAGNDRVSWIRPFHGASFTRGCDLGPGLSPRTWAPAIIVATRASPSRRKPGHGRPMGVRPRMTSVRNGSPRHQFAAGRPRYVYLPTHVSMTRFSPAPRMPCARARRYRHVCQPTAPREECTAVRIPWQIQEHGTASPCRYRACNTNTSACP